MRLAIWILSTCVHCHGDVERTLRWVFRGYTLIALHRQPIHYNHSCSYHGSNRANAAASHSYEVILLDNLKGDNGVKGVFMCARWPWQHTRWGWTPGIFKGCPTFKYRHTWAHAHTHTLTQTHTLISMLKTETIWFETLEVGTLTYQRPAAVYWSGVTNKRKWAVFSFSLSWN